MTSKFPAARAVLLALAAAIVALVIAALLVVSLRPAAQLRPENSPAGTVQRYVLAVMAQDLEQARSFVADPEQNEFCYPYPATGDIAQIDLVRQVTTEQTSSITVALGANSTGFFALLDGSSYEDQFLLEKTDNRWLITAMPWTLGLCTAQEMGY
jgi:hypothetical protein